MYSKYTFSENTVTPMLQNTAANSQLRIDLLPGYIPEEGSSPDILERGQKVPIYPEYHTT